MCSDWQTSLRKVLTNNPNPRVALLGIGHELRGDDAAGVIAARMLHNGVGTHPNLLIIEAGHAPENQTGVIRRFAPTLVVLIDAAQMGQSPGAVCWLDWRATTGVSGSSHTLPLHMIAAYLQLELGCDVALIGIQPAQTEFDQPLSTMVQTALDQLAPPLIEMLKALPS